MSLADVSGVDLAISWEAIEPHNVSPDNDQQYDWSSVDNAITTFEAQGISVRSVRLVQAPRWAVDWAGQENAPCPDRFKMCPPATKHYDDLKPFARDLVARYGTGSAPDIRRFIFWNEPNLSDNWGGRTAADGSHKEYSSLLARFANGAQEPPGPVSVDAGEIAAGSACCDNAPKSWAVEFTDWNTAQGRNDLYDRLTIHAYSEVPRQVLDKINAYQRLDGVEALAVTEFGWSVGTPAQAGEEWKCAASAAQQREYFERVVADVRSNEAQNVPLLSWFNGIDNRPDKDVKCRDLYYDNCDADPTPEDCDPQQTPRYTTNAFGLYRRFPDGSLPAGLSDEQLTALARPVQAAFRALSDG